MHKHYRKNVNFLQNLKINSLKWNDKKFRHKIFQSLLSVVFFRIFSVMHIVCEKVYQSKTVSTGIAKFQKDLI